MTCSNRIMSLTEQQRVLHRIFLVLAIAAQSLLVCGAVSAGPLSVRQGAFYVGTGHIEPWGIEVPGALDSDELTDAIIANLPQYAKFGVNTVSVSLQSPNSRVFSMDGKRLEGDIARRLRRVVREPGSRWMAILVDPFSTDETAWLAGPESYHNAAALLARTFRRADAPTMLTLGVPDAASDVSKRCPVRFDDVASLLELARSIKSASRRQPVAVFAGDADAVDAICGAREADLVIVSDPALLEQAQRLNEAGTGKPIIWLEYAGLKQDLDALGRSVSSIANAPGTYLVASFRSPNDDDDTLHQFLEQVGTARLAKGIKDPGPASPAATFLTEEERRDGWVTLSDGQSLHGWTTLGQDWGAWSVEDGALMCSGLGGRWLRSLKCYKDFVLRLEFKVSQNCNSGIFIHAPLDARASRIGMEIQIQDHAEPSVDDQSLGAIYSVLPPRVYAGRPTGEWNEIEIMSKGRHVVVKLNGQEIQNFTMDDHELLRGRLSDGHIGLQDHGRPVWFRNIRVKELGG
jgi:hypothetical protein